MELGGWRTPGSVVRYQKPTTEQLRTSLKTRRAVLVAAQPTVTTDSNLLTDTKKKAPSEPQLQAGQSVRNMGLGRVELPTSRLSGGPGRKRIPTPFL